MSLRGGTLFEAFEAPQRVAPLDPQTVAYDRGRADGLTEGALAGRAEGLEAGRAEGFAAGRAEGLEVGREAGRAAAEQERDASLRAMADALTAGAADRAELEARFSAAAVEALRTTIAALLPRLARRGLAEEAALMSQEILTAASIGQAALHVAPEHIEAARAALGDAASTGRPVIEVHADPEAGASVARLEWRDGLARFDGEEAARRVIAALDEAAENSDVNQGDLT